jgi:hypothetical protein
MAEQPSYWSDDPFFEDDTVSQNKEKEISTPGPGVEERDGAQTSTKDAVSAASAAQLPATLHPVSTQEPVKPPEQVSISWTLVLASMGADDQVQGERRQS